MSDKVKKVNDSEERKVIIEYYLTNPKYIQKNEKIYIVGQVEFNLKNGVQFFPSVEDRHFTSENKINIMKDYIDIMTVDIAGIDIPTNNPLYYTKLCDYANVYSGFRCIQDDFLGETSTNFKDNYTNPLYDKITAAIKKKNKQLDDEINDKKNHKPMTNKEFENMVKSYQEKWRKMEKDTPKTPKTTRKKRLT